MKVPDFVGVPLMVMVLDDHVAFTPVGKLLFPVVESVPVAPVVVCVIGVNAVLIQSVGLLEATPAVGAVFTVKLPVALTLLAQPPVNGIL